MEVKKLLGEIEAEGEEYALGDTLEEDADESGRGLQGSNPDILTTQTFVFRDCVFDVSIWNSNFAGPSQGSCWLHVHFSCSRWAFLSQLNRFLFPLCRTIRSCP